MKPLFQTLGAVFVAAMLTTATWLPAQDLGQAAKAPEPPLEQFAVANDGDAVLLPVIFEGKKQLFLLDTGSVLTWYDSSLLGRPRQKTTVETTSGNKSTEMFDSPNAMVGKLNLRAGAFVLGGDLRMLRLVSGHEINGIIGMDFLSKYVVQIDVDSGIVSFLPSASKVLGDRLPIFLQKEGPCIEVSVPGLGRPEKFLIDTGSMYFGNMKKELLEALAKGGKARKVGGSLTAGLGGTEANGKWLVESLSVAGLEHRHIVMTQTRDNLLGLGFWSRYVVTFDFPKGVMYLKKSNRACRPNDLDMSGLHILRVEGKTVVHSVDDGSPAAVSGISPNDVLVSIAGDKTDQLSMFALRRRLCCEGKELRITIMRGEETIEVTTVLGKLGSSSIERGVP